MTPVPFRRVFFWIGLLLLTGNACRLSSDDDIVRVLQDDEPMTAFSGVDLDGGGFPIGCEDPFYPLVTGFDVRQTPRLGEPDPRTTFQDQVFGTCIVRVTNRGSDLSPE